MRYAIMALTGAVAVTLAACGSSSTHTASSGTSGPSPTSTTAKPANGKDHVAGLINSVSGNTIQVAQPNNATATVDVTNSTKVAELVPAQLTDVTTGSCVNIRPTRDNPGTARSVLVSPADNGNCPQPQNGRGVLGTVASVNGNTIVVTTAGNPTNVTVTPTTTYAKRTDSTTQAIAQGKCIAARGTNDNSGALQATAITLRPAVNGNCPGTKR
ncbi:MAG: hypothetical protein JO152_01475 [Mycobacteriaceae bacterium]|nr:hypothetical protein [Mycobacteriaceae bacterium]